MSALPTLEQALAYQNDDIPHRFGDEWTIELADARTLFDDVKRWLFLCEQPGVEPTIHGPLVILDEMWHNFVLFTTEYSAYCHDLYGHFIHHSPTTHRDAAEHRAQREADPDGFRAKMVATRSRQRDAVVRHLGPETLLRWYVDYPLRYGDEFFASARKPIRLSWQPDAELIAIAARVRSGA